jgi:hypothetical protein
MPDGDVQREILPIPDRRQIGLTTYDAKDPDTSYPPIRPLRPPMLPPAKPGGKPRRGKRVFTPLRPLYKVENAFARLGMWRRLSRCYEQTPLGAQTWLEAACVAYLCGRLRAEPT